MRSQLPSEWLDAVYQGGVDWPQLRYANADKTERIKPAPFRPYFFIHKEDLRRVKKHVQKAKAEVEEERQYVSVFGKPCVKLILPNPRAIARRGRGGAQLGLRSTIDGLGLTTLESDIPFVDRVMIDEDIRQAEVRSRCGIDIEVDARQGFPQADKAEFPIISIAVVGSDRKEWFFSEDDEEDMLREFYKVVNKRYGLVFGWNWKKFDGMYLRNRLYKLHMKLKLFPVQAMDAMLNYKKLTIWGFMGKKYKLEVVAKRHLWVCPKCQAIYSIIRMEKCERCGVSFEETLRLDHSSMKTKMDAERMWESFASNKEELRIYNMMDAKIVYMLDKLLKLSEPYIQISKMFPVMLRNAPMMSMVLEAIVMREASRSNPRLVLPKRGIHEASLVGGYTKLPIPGVHKTVLSVDFHNLYPSVMATYKLSPELVMLFKAWRDSGLDFDMWTERVFNG